MRVLDYYTDIEFVSEPILILLVAAVAIFLIFASVASFKYGDMGIGASFLAGAVATTVLFVALVKQGNINTVRMKVLMEEKVDLYEFLNEYKIISRDGAILTLEPIDQEGYEK